MKKARARARDYVDICTDSVAVFDNMIFRTRALVRNPRFLFPSIRFNNCIFKNAIFLGNWENSQFFNCTFKNCRFDDSYKTGGDYAKWEIVDCIFEKDSSLNNTLYWREDWKVTNTIVHGYFIPRSELCTKQFILI